MTPDAIAVALQDLQRSMESLRSDLAGRGSLSPGVTVANGLVPGCVPRTLGPGRLFKSRRGRVARWGLDWTDAQGKRHRQVLADDRRSAETRRMAILRERDLQQQGLTVGQGMMLRALADNYVADLRHHVSERHLLNVEGKLRLILGHLGPVRVQDVTPHAVIEFRNGLLAKGVSHRTANCYASTLRAMLRWAVDAGLVARNPIERLRSLPEGPRHARCRRRAMSEGEIGRFLDAVRQEDRVLAKTGRSRVPQHPLWKCLLETGCRYGEAIAITWADLDLERRVLHLRAATTKAGRARAIPLLLGLVGDLRALQADHVRVLARPLRPDDRVFLSPRGCHWCRPSNNVRRIFDRLLEAAGIDRVTVQGKLDVHAVRHTLATRLARSGAPLVQAQQILGHSDPRLTARTYTHLGVEDLRGAVEGLQGEPRRKGVG